MGKKLSKTKIYVKKRNEKQEPHDDENKQISMEDQQQHEKHIELVTAKTEFGRNIFNAYLIFKYKLKMDQTLIWDMGCAVFATFIVQFTAGYLLTILFQGSHGYNVGWPMEDMDIRSLYDLREAEEDGKIVLIPTGNEFVAKSLFLWPFIIIALVSTFKETVATWTDYKMFLHFLQENTENTKLTKREAKRMKKEVYLIKYVQLAFDSFYSFMYLWFVVIVSGDHDDKSMLDIIVSLFVFKFILQLDEQVYSMFIANLRMWSTVDVDDLHSAFQGSYLTVESSPVLRRLQFALLLTLSLIITFAYAGSSISMWIALALAFIIVLIITVLLRKDCKKEKAAKARGKTLQANPKEERQQQVNDDMNIC